jgi:hypothetical protein
MAIPIINEHDLRLFALACDQSLVDMERLQNMPVTNDVNYDTNTEPAEVPAAKIKSKKPKTQKVTFVDEASADGDDFESEIARASGAARNSVPFTPGDMSDADEDDEDAEYDLPPMSMQDKHALVMETSRLIRDYGLPYDPPTLRDDPIDIMKKHDAVLRETSTTHGVEQVLVWLKYGVHFLEPILKNKSNINFIRGPATELWRRYMLMFGKVSNPFLALGIILIGSLVATVAANMMGFGVSSVQNMFSFVAPFAGLTQTPPPVVTQSPPMGTGTGAAPRAAPPPTRQRPAPPPPNTTSSGKSRPAMSFD